MDTIMVPDNLPDNELIHFYRGWQWRKPRGRSITIDFSNVNHISPWAVTQFAMHGLWIKEYLRKKVNIVLNKRSVAGGFIARSGFLSLFDQTDDIQTNEHDPEKTVPLTRIANSQDIPVFAKQVMQILQIDDEEVEGALRYSLIELLRNVVQHSQSPVGGLAMAQFYPRLGVVKLVVADSGIGIQ